MFWSSQSIQNNGLTKTIFVCKMYSSKQNGGETMKILLTEKDKKDANKIKELFLSLDENEKNMAIIYLSALRDRQLVDERKTG